MKHHIHLEALFAILTLELWGYFGLLFLAWLIGG